MEYAFADYILIIGSLIILSAISSYAHTHTIDANVFLLSISVGISIICALNIFPMWTMTISVGIIIGILYNDIKELGSGFNE